MNKDFHLIYEGHRMTPIIQKLQDLKIAFDAYERVDTETAEKKIIMVYSTNTFLKDAIRTLETNLNDIRNNNCRDAIPQNIKELTKLAYWLKEDGRLKQEMYAFAEKPLNSYDFDFIPKHKDTIELYDAIVERIKRMIELLLEIDEAVKEADETELYQSLYRNLRAQYCEDEALDVFDDMMRNSGKITFGKLKMMQMLVIAKFINGGTLNCAPDTNYYDKVDVEFDMKIMPEEFTYEEYFIRGWAVINRSIEWKEDIVVPDYSCVGLFFNQRWDKLSDWNLKQVFLLDTILAKIHQKMVELKPELGKYLPNTSDESLEGTNYFAIYINLLKMFEEPWFKEFRSDKKYSLKWIEQFLNDLMRSEWRDEIADEWYKPDMKKSVLGYIIGCLITAGVLEGSDSAIGSAVVRHIKFDEKAIMGKTMAINFGKGRKKGYCDWICDYVKH